MPVKVLDSSGVANERFRVAGFERDGETSESSEKVKALRTHKELKMYEKDLYSDSDCRIRKASLESVFE